MCRHTSWKIRRYERDDNHLRLPPTNNEADMGQFSRLCVTYMANVNRYRGLINMEEPFSCHLLCVTSETRYQINSY